MNIIAYLFVTYVVELFKLTDCIVCYYGRLALVSIVTTLLVAIGVPELAVFLTASFVLSMAIALKVYVSTRHDGQ